jgi:hypothetical protein
MSLIDIVLSLFSSEPAKPFYGSLDPNDIDGFVRAQSEVDEAKRHNPGALPGALAKYGFRDHDTFENAWTNFIAYCDKTGRTQQFVAAMGRHQMQQASAKMGINLGGNQEPVEGVTIELLADITANREFALAQGGPPAAAQSLAAYGLDEARYQRIYQTWMSRMSGNADLMGAMTLTSMWNSHLHIARNTRARRGGVS